MFYHQQRRCYSEANLIYFVASGSSVLLFFSPFIFTPCWWRPCSVVDNVFRPKGIQVFISFGYTTNIKTLNTSLAVSTMLCMAWSHGLLGYGRCYIFIFIWPFIRPVMDGALSSGCACSWKWRPTLGRSIRPKYCTLKNHVQGNAQVHYAHFHFEKWNYQKRSPRGGKQFTSS